MSRRGLPGGTHPWSASPEQVGRAEAMQRRLAGRVRQAPAPAEVRRVAGADCSYSGDETVCAAAVVVWDVEERTVVESATSLSGVPFPYIPGLFSFREAPAILAALQRLAARPELLICHGHGVAHPRRFGLASHVGVLAGIPAVGCAERRLCGSFDEPAASRGSVSPLHDGGELIGTVLRTRSGVRPLFVSVGHLVDLPAAVSVILACTPRYRLPEPLRLAHRLAGEALRGEPGRPYRERGAGASWRGERHG
jgi:deoxyribonuclease V